MGLWVGRNGKSDGEGWEVMNACITGCDEAPCL